METGLPLVTYNTGSVCKPSIPFAARAANQPDLQMEQSIMFITPSVDISASKVSSKVATAWPDRWYVTDSYPYLAKRVK
jgi:hypothetical protein